MYLFFSLSFATTQHTTSDFLFSPLATPWPKPTTQDERKYTRKHIPFWHLDTFLFFLFYSFATVAAACWLVVGVPAQRKDKNKKSWQPPKLGKNRIFQYFCMCLPGAACLAYQPTSQQTAPAASQPADGVEGGHTTLNW